MIQYLFLGKQNTLSPLDSDRCHSVRIKYSPSWKCFFQDLICLHHKCNFTALNFRIRLNEQAVCKKPWNVLCDFLIKHKGLSEMKPALLSVDLNTRLWAVNRSSSKQTVNKQRLGVKCPQPEAISTHTDH